jgi:MFS family permease
MLTVQVRKSLFHPLKSQSIYFPALSSLQADLNASSSTLALTVSLFILGQGFFPQIWTAISEISGRKLCYLSALVIYLVATAVASRASTIGVFIAMRVLQALGSSAVLALGAGSLADIYDVSPLSPSLRVFARNTSKE